MSVITQAELDYATALEGMRAVLRLIGENPDDDGLIRTPARIVDGMMELASRPGDPATDLAVTFSGVEHAGTPVTVGPIRFVSMCEHHLLPFTGYVWLSYVPQEGRVVGLSKLPRTVAHFAGRAQVQERLTAQIAEAIAKYLDPAGVAVLVRATHSCMVIRGARSPEAIMETFDLRGSLDSEPFRGVFFSAVRASMSGG